MTPNFGWRKDKRDKRDYLHSPFLVEIPTAVDLSKYCPPVRDQGNLGSCVGFGIAGNLSGTAKQCSVYSEWFSPSWVYSGARLIEGTLGSDSGAYPRDALDFLLKNGCLLEHFKPYSDTLDTTDPTTWNVAKNARDWPLVTYIRVTDGVPNICDAIAQGYFISIGSPWYDSWIDVGSDGTLPEDYSSVAGGHETFLFGYDQTKKVFYGQNSWNVDWGRAGTYVMPFSAIDQFKVDGGYDCHYVTVNWTATPTPPTPTEKHYIALAKSVDSGKTWKILLKVRV
jgi:hypothetical protein